MSYAYSVSIKLSLANFASQAIRVVAADLLKAHRAATNLQDKLSALKLAAVGYGLDKMGAGIFGFLQKSVDASKEYTRQLSLMNAAGMSQKEIAESVATAWKTSQEVVTSTAADNLKALRELRSALPDRMGEAYAVLPIVQRVKTSLEALTGREQPNIAFDLVKAAEQRTPGRISQEALVTNADLMGRTLMAMGGTLNVHDYLMALKQSKTAAFSFSDQFIYDYLPTLMQEVKTGGSQGSAGTAGTALMTLFTQIVQGHVKKAALPTWLEMGLIKPGDIIRNAGGNYQIRPGGVLESGLFAQNPLAWAEKITPLIARYATQHHLTQLQAMTAMGMPRNAEWVLSTLVLKQQQFERDRALIQSTPNTYESFQRLLKTNPQVAEAALQSQYQNVLALIGYQILPKLVPLMQSFARVLGNVSGWMEQHPRRLDALVAGFGALSLASMTVGKVLMTAGIIKFLGMGPMIGAAIRGVGLAFAFAGELLFANPIGVVLLAIGAAAWAIYRNWDYIGPKLAAAWAAVKGAAIAFADWIGGKFSGMWEGIKSVSGRFFDWMHDKFKGLLERLGLTSPVTDTRSSPTPSSYMLAGAFAGMNITIPLIVDGVKFAEVAVKHIGKAMSRPHGGTSSFDGRATLAPAGGIGDIY